MSATTAPLHITARPTYVSFAVITLFLLISLVMAFFEGLKWTVPIVGFAVLAASLWRTRRVACQLQVCDRGLIFADYCVPADAIECLTTNNTTGYKDHFAIRIDHPAGPTIVPANARPPACEIFARLCAILPPSPMVVPMQLVPVRDEQLRLHGPLRVQCFFGKGPRPLPQSPGGTAVVATLVITMAWLGSLAWVLPGWDAMSIARGVASVLPVTCLLLSIVLANPARPQPADEFGIVLSPDGLFLLQPDSNGVLAIPWAAIQEITHPAPGRLTFADSRGIAVRTPARTYVIHDCFTAPAPLIARTLANHSTYHNTRAFEVILPPASDGRPPTA